MRVRIRLLVWTLCVCVLCTSLPSVPAYGKSRVAPPKYDEAELKRQFDSFINSLDTMKIARGYPGAVKKLLSGDYEKQLAAIKTLAATGEIEVIPWLLPFLDSAESKLLIWTGSSLEKLVSSYVLKRRDMTVGYKVVIKPLGPDDKDLKPLAWIVLKMFRKPHDGSTHAYAATMTRYLGLTEFEVELKRCLTSRHPAVRNKAKRAIKSLELNGYKERCPSGMVSYWKFDEGSGRLAYDTSGSNHGSLINCPVWTTGQVDGALSFDGVDDYVDCSNDSSLNLGGDSRTLGFWINTASATLDPVWYSRNTAYTAQFYVWKLVNGRIRFNVQERNEFVKRFNKSIVMGDGSARRSRTGQAKNEVREHVQADADELDKGSFDSNKAVNDGAWHYIAVVWDVSAKTGYIYIDGTEDSQTTNTNIGTLLDFDTNYIGNFDTSYFEGSIDEVAIYNRVLSATEIRQHYQAGLGYEVRVKPADVLRSQKMKSSEDLREKLSRSIEDMHKRADQLEKLPDEMDWWD